MARIELAYDSRPVGETTPFEPLITFTDSDSGQRVNPDIRYEKGWLLLNELPPGRYRITIDIDANMQNPSLFPGDLFFEGYINVDKCDTCGSSTLHYDLQRIIHLTSPGDNSGRVHIWGVNCGLEHAPFASPVVFSWEPIAENVDYNYTVYRMSLGPDHSWAMTTNGQTKETTIRLSLPPNLEEEYYLLQMTAFRADKPVGVLVSQGLCNFLSGYQFTVSRNSHE
jgi:hypothetical protein